MRKAREGNEKSEPSLFQSRALAFLGMTPRLFLQLVIIEPNRLAVDNFPGKASIDGPPEFLFGNKLDALCPIEADAGEKCPQGSLDGSPFLEVFDDNGFELLHCGEDIARRKG